MAKNNKEVLVRGLKAILRKNARQMKRHFEDWGWPLCESLDQIILDELGLDTETYLLKALGEGHKITVTSSGIRYATKDYVELAVYDPKTNKIIICALDKIDKYGGIRYTWLGRV